MASPNTTKYINSPFQWAGSKNKALGHLLPVLEKYRRHTFVEPFVGAMNVALNFKANEYVFGDLNKDLVNSYRVIKNNTEEYVSSCEKLFKEGFEQYYTNRDAFNNTDQWTVERAALFQYLNKHGFNGLCRYNKKGEYNVPVGTVDKPKSVPVQQIQVVAELLKTQHLMMCAEFGSMFNLAEQLEDALVYCDPPYVPLTSEFDYTGEGFTFEQQQELKGLAKESKHTTIISNHWTPLTQELYYDATEVVVFDVQRTISCNGSERKRVQECIVVYEKE